MQTSLGTMTVAKSVVECLAEKSPHRKYSVNVELLFYMYL